MVYRRLPDLNIGLGNYMLSFIKTKGILMGFQLQPTDIADCYSLSEITTEITAIKAAITIARQSLRDKFGDTQAQQDITRQTLKDLNQELGLYIKAKNILNDTDSSTAVITTINYNPSIPKI